MDFTYLKTISDGDLAFVEEFISTFERNANKIIADIISARAEKNLDRQSKLAHQFKPTLEMLGLKCLDTALKIQHEPESVKDSELEQMREECTDAVDKLKEEFNL